MMLQLDRLAIVTSIVLLGNLIPGSLVVSAQEEGCLSCHEGIERFTDGAMQETIEALGVDYGDPAGCVMCHGGTPDATTAEAAHQGTPATLQEAGGPQRFYPDPGSVWIADETCGQCHQGYAERLAKSLMNTRGGQAAGQSLVLGPAVRPQGGLGQLRPDR